jgi:anti-anti-sigma factor
VGDGLRTIFPLNPEEPQPRQHSKYTLRRKNMAFKSALEIVNGVAKITLSGELDAAAAPAFRTDVEKAAAAKVKAVALLMKDLEYMASAGLRALVFAKQKMGTQTTIYMISLQENVKETITMTGFQNSVTFMDEYDAATIEGA